jgi:rhodanese-related sulfurtransferase
MAIRQVTPPEAHQVLQQDPRAVYLDVRTEAEFEAGHPQGACNIPVVFMDAGRGGVPNPEFLAVVEKNLPRDTPLAVGCQAGGRSQHACELLERAGFTDLRNVQGGFGGARDQSGRVVVAGWRDAGLPVETGAPPGATYAELAGRR